MEPSTVRDAGTLLLAVEGLEATQATQFYHSCRHLDTATAERDNAVPLVAGKPLAIRVYPDVRKPTHGKDWQNGALVDGELWFQPGGSGEWRQAARFPGTVQGRPAHSIERGDARQTLNFRIPEEFARRTLRVRARVWIDASRSEPRISEWAEDALSFVETRLLRLRLFGVHYRGRGLDLSPPTAAEALDTLGFLRKTYPVSRVEVLSYDIIEFSGDLTDGTDARCGRGWSELLLRLSRLRAASASDVPHYALLPAGVPNNGLGGFGSPLGIGVSFTGEGSAMAQELGHVFRRQHAPGGGAQDTDPLYPVYAAYPSGSIGEYGFDPATGEVFSPRSSHDFMGYCGNYWVSPHTYRALLDVFKGPPAEEPTSPEGSAGEEDLHLHLGFSLHRDHGVELESGLTLSGPAMESEGEETSYRVELRDDGDHVLSSRTIRSPGVDLNAGEELHLLESIAFRPGARRLVFLQNERHAPTVFEIPRGEFRVELVGETPGPPGATLEGTIDLRWNVTCATAERLVFFLRYSHDGGASWQPVDMGLEWRSCRVDLDQLPGGDDCRLQVIASTILRTAIAETVPFRVRRKPRCAMIAGSRTTRRLDSQSSVELTGTAHSPNGFVPESELNWSSSLQGQLGNGSWLTVHDLVPGDHEITVTAPDGLGGVTRARTLVRVKPADHGGLGGTK